MRLCVDVTPDYYLSSDWSILKQRGALIGQKLTLENWNSTISDRTDFRKIEREKNIVFKIFNEKIKKWGPCLGFWPFWSWSIWESIRKFVRRLTVKRPGIQKELLIFRLLKFLKLYIYLQHLKMLNCTFELHPIGKCWKTYQTVITAETTFPNC